MTNYKLLVQFILGWEGGKVNDKDDKGGLTNKGITYLTYKELCTKVYKVEPSKSHFDSLTSDEVGLMVEYFWKKSTANGSVNSQKVSEAITTWRWGSGQQGLIWFQKMLNECFDTKLLEDGIIGIKTCAKINALDDFYVFRMALKYRKERFEKICKSDPTQTKFLKGWLNRLGSFAKKHNEYEYFKTLLK